jgi:hypothetical protein
VCVATADLRVLRIETYGQSLANNLPFIVDVSLENHGRKATATTEGRVCANGISGKRCNDGLSDTFVIPVVQPGERVTIRRTLSGKIEGYGDTRDIGVIIDPDESIADFSRTNNSSIVKGVKVESPTMTLLQRKDPVKTTSDRSYQPQQVFRIQNPSRTIATGEIPLLVKFNSFSGTNCRTKLGTEPLTLPSIPPKAVVEFTIVFPRLFATCSPNQVLSRQDIYWQFEPAADSPNGLTIADLTDVQWQTPGR